MVPKDVHWFFLSLNFFVFYQILNGFRDINVFDTLETIF